MTESGNINEGKRKATDSSLSQQTQQDTSPKARYHELCEEEEEIPIFSRDWWLDTVCGADQWDVILTEENGRITASLPVYVPVHGAVSMPCYTQTMGPWLSVGSPDMKYATLLGRRQALMVDLIEHLKSYRSFMQNFSPEITDWLPFSWAGFKETTRYTYRLENLEDNELMMAEMSENMRRNIRRAQDSITIKKGITVQEFMRLHEATFTRQHLKDKQDSEVLIHLIEESRRRGQGDLWGGYDDDGQLHAAAFIVWQKSCAWYLAGGGDPALRSSAAQSLVLWTAIQFVKDRSRKFDFEGSMLPGVERFFREFGAKQLPYFRISKGDLSIWERIIIKLKKLI